MKVGDRVIFRADVPVHNEGRPNRHVGCLFRIVPAEYENGWLWLRCLYPPHWYYREDHGYLEIHERPWESKVSDLEPVEPVR